MVAVSKPSWLTRALDLLNWDIFTWKVYIGDAVEWAIDWTLVYLNNALDWAKVAYDWGVAAWDKAVEVGKDAWDDLQAEATKLGDKIIAAKDWAKERIDDANELIDKVDTAWDNFKRDTLPKLLDTQWVRDFFGRGVASISDWWAARRKEVGDLIDTEVTPVREEVNKHTSWLDLIKELFTDPEKWLLDMLERMLARFW